MVENSSFILPWFCGAEYSETLGHVRNHCYVHFINSCVHLTSGVFFTFFLVILGRFTSLRLYYSRALIPYPGHTVKWLLVAILFIILLFAVGEGILTDITRHDTRQPQLYIPQILACISTILSLVYYHHMEYWNQPRLAWLLLTYWIFTIVGESIHLVRLTHDLEFDVTILRLDMSIIILVIHCCCACVEINLIRSKIFGWRYKEKPYPRDLKKKNLYFIYPYTNIISRMIYWSLTWILLLGYKQTIELSDLGCLPENSTCKIIHSDFATGYEKEKERASRLKRAAPSLWRTYARVYGRTSVTATTIRTIGDTFGIISPVAVGGVVKYATNLYDGVEPDPITTSYITVSEFFSNGFVLIGVIFIAVVLRGLLIHHAFNMCILQSIHIRTALQSYTYEKTLHLTSWALSIGEKVVGQIINHMSVDAMALQWLSMYQLYIWTIPYQLVVILTLLYFEMGISALIGASLFLVAAPLQYKIANIVSSIQRTVLKYSDQRLKKSNELLQGIKLLKLYGWEELFSSAIETVRINEVGHMLKSGVFMICTSFLSQATPVLVTFISFAVYSYINESPLTPELAFSSLALFNQLIIPLLMLPNIVGYLVPAIASTRRLEHFFNAPEMEDCANGRPPTCRGFAGDSNDEIGDNNDHGNSYTQISRNVITYKHSTERIENFEKDTERLLIKHDCLYGTFNDSSSDPISTIPTDLLENIDVQIVGGNFSWDTDSDVPLLRDINLRIPTGSLTMIIGMVGSGKTTLISALLTEMKTIAGSVQFKRERSQLSYCPQKAWLQNASLRDNILFGCDFNTQRYKTILDVCALQPDIDMLPAGDQTEIGEKGINLSGGQKQRVSVARALYSHTDIILLDDPLSALDVHVGCHLMEQGILGFLKKENRTVILVTHQIQYLKHADQVIVMDGCMISKSGDFKDVREQEPEWERMLAMISDSEKERSSDDEYSIDERKMIRQKIYENAIEENAKHDERGILIEEEERETGSISWRVYLAYARAVRYPLVLLTLCIALAQGTALILNNFWLAEWSEAGKNINNKTQDELDDELQYYIRGYAIFSFTYIGLALLATSCLVIFSLLGAKRLHIKLLRTIVHAPMRFFDTTPVGRILNRFSDDTNIIDQRLWVTIYGMVISALFCLSAIIVNAVVTPIFLAFVTPLIVVYFLIQWYYITTARQLQRIMSITRSPVYAHFSETIGGLSTIRAYRHEQRFRRRLLERIDVNNIAQVYLATTGRWMSVRLELIGAIIIFISGLSGLLSSVLFGLEASLVGLSLTYALTISGHLTYLVRMSADCEMQMNSVERVEHYTKIEPELYQGIFNPPRDWPETGTVKLQNMSVRYADGLPPVLEDVNIHFKAGQKIGICGRTGSGKSSLALSIFRIIDTFQGRIVIDGVDISTVPLLTLRNRLAIIPQDPVLFQGTIRFNLDPVCKRTDEELWEALGIAQLKGVVSELDMQLDSNVSEDGENFSVGQRQLICLARAFLRKAHILVMDEATASIDLKTDDILKNVVATAFADRTVLTIAHRISTILDSDVVLVLSDGKVIEYDTPQNLLKKEDSMFASLVKGSSDH